MTLGPTGIPPPASHRLTDLKCVNCGDYCELTITWATGLCCNCRAPDADPVTLTDHSHDQKEGDHETAVATTTDPRVDDGAVEEPADR